MYFIIIIILKIADFDRIYFSIEKKWDWIDIKYSLYLKQKLMTRSDMFSIKAAETRLIMKEKLNLLWVSINL